MVQLSVNHMPFLELPLAEELRLGARLRADVGHELGQGLWLVKTSATGWAESARLLRRESARVSYLAAAATMAADDEDGWAEFRGLLLEAVRWCADSDVPTIYFTSGRSGDRTPEAAADAWCRQIEPVRKLADELGVNLALENSLSLRSDISFVHSVREAGALATRAGIGLCVDLFSAWQEHHLADTLADHLDRIHILQYSDFTVGTLYQPARRVPGDGDIPLPWLVELVPHLGYAGLVDLELLGPAIAEEGAEAAVRRGLAWLTAQRWE